MGGIKNNRGINNKPLHIFSPICGYISETMQESYKNKHTVVTAELK